MTDTGLSALFPSEPMWIGGERVCLRPVVLKELPVLERLMGGWGLMVATGGEALTPDLGEDLDELLAGASGRPLAWVKALPAEDYERLFSLALALNQGLFERSRGDVEAQVPWPQVVQRLLSRGHRMEDIENYTLDQAATFLKEVARLETSDLARAISAAPFANAPKEAAKAVKDLSRD